MKNLVVGDVVWLKSSKTVMMTIKSIEIWHGEAFCQWFDNNYYLREAVFALASLDKNE